jgi:hypothetical protein
MRKIILFTITLFIFSATQAAEYYFCDRSNTYIYLGDTLAHVQQICGQPISTDTKKIHPSKTMRIERWIYYYKPSNPYTSYELHPYQDGALIFDIEENTQKVVQIKVHGKSVNQTTECLIKKPLKIGDQASWVAHLCWMPNDIKRLTSKIPAKNIITQTTLTYQQTPHQPTAQLIFHDDKLVEIKE